MAAGAVVGVAGVLTAEVGAPTIGIAAGPECDGQVLVVTDLVGALPDTPRFVKPKADVFGIVAGAAREFAEEVRRAREGAAREAV